MDARIKSAHDERNGNRTMTPKPFDLSGKVAIVTGGNGGIGLGMARGLAEAGAAVAVVGRNEAKSIAAVAELEQSGGKAMSVIADVTDKAAVAAMVERVKRELGRIDILVNNAGINIRKPPQARAPRDRRPARTGAGAHAGGAMGRDRRLRRHRSIPQLTRIRLRHRHRNPCGWRIFDHGLVSTPMPRSFCLVTFRGNQYFATIGLPNL